MGKFCKYCGKPLKEGEECTCHESKMEKSVTQPSGISNSYHQNYNEKSMQYHGESNIRNEEKEYLPQYDVNVLSVLGFVMSICSMGFVGFLANLSCAMLAIIFSVLAKSGLKEQDRLGKHFATMGLVLGIVDAVWLAFNYC